LQKIISIITNKPTQNANLLLHVAIRTENIKSKLVAMLNKKKII